LSVTLDDRGNTGAGGAQTDSASLTLHVNPVPIPPKLTLVELSPLIYREGNGRRRVAPRIRATAGSAPIAEAKVAITAHYVAGEDVLSLPARPLITSAFDSATGVLTLSGTATVAQYQRALRAVRYANTSQNPSADLRVVSFQVRDGVPGNGWSNVVTRS